MDVKRILTTFITIALLTACAANKRPSPIAPSARPSTDTSWASPSGMGKTKEAHLHRELIATMEHWRAAYQRREAVALEKLLADEFTASFSGRTLTRSNTVEALKRSQSELVAIEDVKIRVDERFPVITFRSISRFQAGAQTLTTESLSSLQLRTCSSAEEQRGCERWLVTSATHMPVHQMPPDSDYWVREK